MTTIAHLRSDAYRVPLEVTLTDSTHGAMQSFELVTVRITDDEGAEGLGYTYTVGAGGRAIHSLIECELAPLLHGQAAHNIEFLWQRMWWALHYSGRGGQASLAISAVDIALWDLKARRAGQPLYQALGGYELHVPCYAGGIDLELDTDALIAQTERNLERGFRAIKMKVGRARLHEDIERVGAMRAFLGPDFPLMVDANMRWSADRAIQAARALQPFSPVWLEEPTIPEDIQGHARIVREGGMPIAAGENLHTLHEFAHYMRAGAVTYPEPDVTNCGGVTVFMKVAHLAEAFNLPVTSHGAHDITVHLLAAVPNRSYLEAHGFGLDRYLRTPLQLVDGKAVAPDRPGHGVEFDWRGLDPLRE
ncbi:MAG: mandelate racemase/muconate lactonizing enzyme family protein [Pseudomonadota bacterium]|nr:mandelate racemase/muconate lactonizing enzyme family protein [Pseudomonadota bacterium]